ncbi:conserved hypothetical protein [Talaromyces stipitatus ATCC 10500]|uniref:Uncharacterized protein n=1 Tax=Talaromyces stipitatus (strain ATCC 10500 / CBS 375.48 / QM 6759 / NRRL 1006) TaxID=441959 RepID=B8M1D1_TALSN|nr:uncharacterized protein TSTA_090660 [Talaromyces stipitatus ATCC 10500]EED21827.1 conserved hypothetical protein [Talaromyces stipitatus ATCC 10500]
MFAWAGAVGAQSMGIDPDEERNAPPPPTPLEFPQYVGINGEQTQTVTDFNVIYRHLLTLRKPQDITIDHVKAFNLKVETDIEGLQIVPDELLQGLPPLVWDKSSDDNEASEAHKMGNGVPYPPREKYDVVKKELLLDSDDAFREASRMPPKPGRDRVRLTQSRKFWVGLERMSQYWDTSRDNYYDRLVREPRPEEGTQTVNSPQQQQTITNTGVGDPMDTGDSSAGETNYERVYKGRRLGTGSEMPADIRDETMRGLLEMVAWPFQCQVTVPSTMPRLHVQGLLFPVRHTLVSGRVPQDRQTARSGILEGPVIGVQCRDETNFNEPNGKPGFCSKEFCDLFREIGAMLLLAQERAREGTVEVRPGEGKWWTTVPRFGGADHEGVTGEAANSNNAKEKEDDKDDTNNQSMHKRSRYANPLIPSRRSGRSRRLTPSEKWKIIEPGMHLWDRKMKYMQIGKKSDSPYDDIYMLSHINHHVSILHLRVHRRYIECLTTGSSDLDERGTPEQPWNVLKLRRTKWYDLLDSEHRLEVFHSLWRLYHYLMR